MKPFRWSSGKNEVLQVQRGVSFEAVVVAIESGDLLDIVEHPNRLEASARSTATKDQRINIRLTSEDLGALRARALQEGIPYQTLISSVLHKYVCGRLLDRP
ncbi:MAG: hypothetical protein NTW51_08570 [Cyanobacteria bacterium]|nr:hypothetical protein [Cyanobacteriota bacterium]